MCLALKPKLCFFSVSGSGQSRCVTLRLVDNGKDGKLAPKLKLCQSFRSGAEQSLNVGNGNGNGDGDGNGDGCGGGERFPEKPKLWLFSGLGDGKCSKRIV